MEGVIQGDFKALMRLECKTMETTEVSFITDHLKSNQSKHKTQNTKHKQRLYSGDRKTKDKLHGFSF